MDGVHRSDEMKFTVDEIGCLWQDVDSEMVVCSVKAFSRFSSPLTHWCPVDCEGV